MEIICKAKIWRTQTGWAGYKCIIIRWSKQIFITVIILFLKNICHSFLSLFSVSHCYVCFLDVFEHVNCTNCVLQDCQRDPLLLVLRAFPAPVPWSLIAWTEWGKSSKDIIIHTFNSSYSLIPSLLAVWKVGDLRVSPVPRRSRHETNSENLAWNRDPEVLSMQHWVY